MYCYILFWLSAFCDLMLHPTQDWQNSNLSICQREKKRRGRRKKDFVIELVVWRPDPASPQLNPYDLLLFFKNFGKKNGMISGTWAPDRRRSYCDCLCTRAGGVAGNSPSQGLDMELGTSGVIVLATGCAGTGAPLRVSPCLCSSGDQTTF